MSSFEFTEKKSVEESAFVWKIPEFTKLQETKSKTSDRERLQFSAGESIDQPSKWSLQLCFETGNEIGLYMYLKESLVDSANSVHASFTGTVNYPNSGNEFVSSKPEFRREYKNFGTGWGKKEFLNMDELKAAGILDNDILTIHVKLIIYGEVLPTPVCSEDMLKENALNRMSKHFPELLNSGEYSDFVIRVKAVDSGEYIEKKVHRNILSVQSSVFATMLRSQMSEKESGVVTIEDLTVTGLDVLLEFMYAGNIPGDWKLVPEEIVNAAEKYNLPLLKKYIGERLHEVCTQDNAFSLFNLAEQHGLQNASKYILKYIHSNLKSVLKRI